MNHNLGHDANDAQFEALIRDAKKASLWQPEKEAMKGTLVRFMRQHPPATTQPAFWLQAFFQATIRQAYQRPAMRYATLGVMVFLLAGTSVTFAAQRALPGDFLYTVKTGVNERVLALTLFSNQAKARYDIDLAQLRLQETETAAAQGKLDNQSTSEVRLLFNDHVTDIQNRILAINKTENARVAIELNSQLEALLKAHVKVIGALADENASGHAKDIKNILSDVEQKAGQITENRRQNEADFVTQVSKNSTTNAQNKLHEVEAAMRELNAVMVIDDARLDNDSRRKIEADVKAANQYIIDGKVKLVAGDSAGAFILFQNAARTVQEASVYVAARANLRAINLPDIIN